MCAAGCRATTVCVFVIATVVNTLFKDAEKHKHVAGSAAVLLQSSKGHNGKTETKTTV